MNTILWFIIVSVMFQATTGSVDCSSECLECKNIHYCTNCTAGHYPKGFESTRLTSIKNCEKCPPHCVECYDHDEVCTACKFKISCGTSCNADCMICVTTNTVCTRCQTGWYGSRCEFACSGGCSGSCEKNTGNCHTCKVGFYGNNCTGQCSPTCKDGICDKVNGHCLACNDTFYGQNCTHCPKRCLNRQCTVAGMCKGCVDGYYGDQCEFNCSLKCQSRCVQTSGHCEFCKNGYFKSHCTGVCSAIAPTCEHCTYDEGDMNSTCVKCESQYYYSSNNSAGNCTQCPDGCLNGTCDPSNGACVEGCKTGYWTAQCDKSCSENCNNCHQDNGQCLECASRNVYGDWCNISCNSRCERNECNQQTGMCLGGCRGKYYGKKCNHVCPETCKANTTSLMAVCHQQNGSCAECDIGHFGELCTSVCDENCVDNACSKDTGYCVHGCSQGYQQRNGSCVNKVSAVTEAKTLPVIGGTVGGVVMLAVVLTSVMVVGRIKLRNTRMAEREDNVDMQNVIMDQVGHDAHPTGLSDTAPHDQGSIRPDRATLEGPSGCCAVEIDTNVMYLPMDGEAGREFSNVNLPDEEKERDIFSQSLPGDAGEKERDISFSQSFPGPEDGEAKERYSKLAIGRDSGLEAGIRPCGQNPTKLQVEHADDGYIGPDPEVDNYVNTEAIDSELNLGHGICKLEAAVRSCGQNHTNRLPMKHSDDGYIGPDPEVDNYVNTESVDDEINSGHVIGKHEAAVRSCGQNHTNLPREHRDDGYIGPDPEVDSSVNAESVEDVLNLGQVIGKLEAVVRPCGQHFTREHADDGYIGPDPAIDSYINTRSADHDGELNLGRVTNNKPDAQITPCTKSTVPPNGHCDDGYVGPDKEAMSHSLYVNTEQAEGQDNFADDIMDELETRLRL